MHFCYGVHGLVIASEFALPELEPRQRRPVNAPDVRIAMGAISELPARTTELPYLDAEHGQALLKIPGAGRFLVQDGRNVVVEPDDDADPSVVRLFLLGSVIGLLCHQRGLLPLHASAVEIDGEAVAFVGIQGQGKSTMAAHCLAHAPARLVADDILVVSFDAMGRPWAHPGMPSVKLWRDALAALGRGVESLRPDWLRADKFHMPVMDCLVQAPVPLMRVYVLESDADAGAGTITPLTGVAAAANLIAHTYRVEYLDAAEQRPTHFSTSTRLARSVQVMRLARRRALEEVAATATIVFADVRSARQVAQ